MFDWNDLKHFLAVARHGSTIAAAKALGVNQSTVQRRPTELEDRLGRDVVARLNTGYQLTPFGEELRAYAEQVEAAVAQLEQHAAQAVATTGDERSLSRSSKRADVAFRSGDTEDELVGRKIADSIWAVYASKAMWRAAAAPTVSRIWRAMASSPSMRR